MVGPMPPDTLNPNYPPRTEHRPAIAVLDVFIVAWTRPDGLVGLLVAKSSEPDFVNRLTVEVRSRTGVNMTTFQGHVHSPGPATTNNRAATPCGSHDRITSDARTVPALNEAWSSVDQADPRP
jgi:hypothetical protein